MDEEILFPTTSVGSFPKPDYLKEARTKFARKEITQEQLDELARRATREWITFQDEIGVDILVDGEMYRGDMAAYFCENLEGCTQSGVVRSYGNRYYKKPIVKSALRRPRPITVDWFKFAQSLTKRPVKGMLTGPYTLMDWSFDEFYPDRRARALAFAEVIRQEAEDLQAAGAKYIQIDEPAASVRPEEMDLVIESMGVVTKNLKVKTLTHICYGRFEKIYPQMLDIPVDQIDLEMKNSNFDLLPLFKKYKFTKEIGLGVTDVHSHRTETVEEILDGIRRSLEVFDPRQIYVDPDCGLKTREVEEAKAEMRVIVEAAKKIRQEVGVTVGAR